MGSIATCLAFNVRDLRKKRNLTQGDLAQKSGISVIFLQSIESEKKWISPDTVASIAKALDVSPSRLFQLPPELEKPRKIRRSALTNFEHVPDDVMYALATTCKHPQWKWEVFRWILDGYQKTI